MESKQQTLFTASPNHIQRTAQVDQNRSSQNAPKTGMTLGSRIGQQATPMVSSGGYTWIIPSVHAKSSLTQVGSVQSLNEFQQMANSSTTPRSSIPTMKVDQRSMVATQFKPTIASDMSTLAKMRFGRSRITMSSNRTEGDDFTIKNNGNMQLKKDHMDQKFNMPQAVGAAAVALALFSAQPVMATDIGSGQKVFEANCAACHAGGQNVIQSEKTLQKDALSEYLMGGFNEKAIINQATNGKNAMPAFGGKLSDEDIQNVAAFVYDQASGDKWE